MNRMGIITLAMQIIIRTTLLILFFVSCRSKDDCVGITSSHYRGNGQIFFHKPISGNAYEFIFIPVCKINSNRKIELRSRNLLPGISFTCTSDSPLAMEVLRAARRMPINTYPNLAEQFQEIYICPIYMEIEGIINDTKVITNHYSDNIRKIMSIENKEVVITYFYSNYPKIHAFKISS